MKVRVTDYIVSYLRSLGVNKVFMLNGGGMMHLVDAIARADGMTYICNHHEQASAMASDGYARLSGQLGVCCATTGPGATNILTGVVGAWQDSTATLFLTGQSKSTQTIAVSGINGLRQFGTFEVDIIPIMQSVTKYAHMVTDAKTIRYHLEKAVYLATKGRPGPVLLDLPLDIQGALIEPSELDAFIPTEDTYIEFELADVVTKLTQAKRPLIIAGAGIRISQAVDLFKEFIDKSQIPVITTQLGKDILPYDHPLFVGHSGPKGDRPGNFAVQTADLIISLGASLHGQTTGWENKLFAPNAFKIQVDIDSAVLQRSQVDIGMKICVDTATFISKLTPLLPTSPASKWRRLCQHWKEKYAVRFEPHLRSPERINFYHFAEALSLQLPDTACVVTDAGSAFYVMGQAFRLKDGQRFISSGSLGAMGYALPAANGASFVSEDNPVICVTGDGSLMTNIHELATMREYQRNIKLFVINNNGYVSMRNTQREFFGGLLVAADADSGVFIPPIDSLATSYQLPFISCSLEADLEKTIQKVLSMAGPVICEIVSMPDQKIIPSVSSKRLSDGRMESTPLHEMVPRLPDEQIAEEIKNAYEII